MTAAARFRQSDITRAIKAAENAGMRVGPDSARFSDGEWVIDGEYGSGFDAGWMHRHEALNFICDGVERYRAPSITPDRTS